MTNKEIYKAWAPFNKKWVDWVRPVPFVEIDQSIGSFVPTGIILPSAIDFCATEKDVAVIIDLPDTESVEAGILLTKHGYRPIPIYNGTAAQKGSRATTDNCSILSALKWGASILSNVEINENANPVFLVDSNRLHRRRIDLSIFDNSWDVYHQDLPTEEYFLANGINKILIISNQYAKDLKKVFAEHTKKKISIFITDGYDEPKLIRKGR